MARAHAQTKQLSRSNTHPVLAAPRRAFVPLTGSSSFGLSILSTGVQDGCRQNRGGIQRNRLARESRDDAPASRRSQSAPRCRECDIRFQHTSSEPRASR